jgi:membrane fusion protein, multidrug efflux system
MKAWMVILPAALIFSACSKKVEVAEEARPARVLKVSSSDGAAVTTYAAEIRARYEGDLSFRVPGKLLARSVDLGATVKRGQVIARLDAQDANLNAQSARASLASAESDLEFNKAELARYKDLREKNFVSQGVYDQKDNAYKAALARRDAAKASASVSGNQANYTTLTADADGVVTAVSAEPGQVVAAGQAVVRVARKGEKDAVFNVAENQLSAVRANPNVKVSLWANPGKLYSGKVREVASAADAVTRTYAVKVVVDDAEDELRLGMSANVVFAGAEASPGRTIVVPMTAITQGDDKSGAKPAVWVVDATNKVQLKPVTVVRYTESGAILGGGLNGGEVVVVAGVHKLRAGQTVKPMQDGAAPAAAPMAAAAPPAAAPPAATATNEALKK